MPARRKNPKIEALVVNAIRRLQDVQGSSSREISNYISQEYDVPAKEIRQQVQLALQRGLSYGILQRSKGGYYTCNRDYLGQLALGDATGDGVMEPCPGHGRWRIYWRKRRAAERRRRETRRRWEERRKRERRRRSRAARESRRRRSRRRRRRRRRRGRRRSRTRSRGRRGRRRGRRRRGRTRTRSRADFNEIETEAMASEPKGNEDAPKDGNNRNSRTSISERSSEQNTPQNSQSLNMPDDD